jgi:hypothetical protein
MTWGIRLARWAWPVAAAAVVVLVARRLGVVWDEARTIGSAPDYFNAVGQYRLSISQSIALRDVGLSPDWHGALVVTRLLLVAATALTIAFLLWRRARTWAPLFLAWFLLNGMLITTFTDESTDGALPGWLGIPVLVLFGGGIVSMVGLLLVFPDDRSAHWVIAALLGLAAVPMYAGITDNDTLGDLLWQYGVVVLFVAIGVGLVMQTSRVLRSRDRTARDLLVLTVAMLGVFIPMSIGSDAWSGIEGSRDGLGSLVWRLAYETAYMAIPLVYGLAVLWILVRRGHWDMDVRLKGSVGYAGLSTLLVLGYFGLVAAVQVLIDDVSGTTGNTFALMVSTAVVAAAFLPLRGRLQALVDRLFDRRRRDAERMVQAFEAGSGRAARPEEVADALVDAVDRVFRPAHAELWTVREHEQ